MLERSGRWMMLLEASAQKLLQPLDLGHEKGRGKVGANFACWSSTGQTGQGRPSLNLRTLGLRVPRYGN